MKKIGTYRLITVLLLVLYSTILFLCQPFYDPLTLWMCYGFVVFGFGTAIVLSVIRSKQQAGMKVSLFIIPWAYITLEIVISIILVTVVNAVPCFIDLRTHLFIQIPLLILFFAALIIVCRGNDTVVRRMEEQTAQVENIRRITLRIQTYNAVTRNVKVKDRLDSLAMAVQTIEPFVHPELQDVEKNLIAQIDNLNGALASTKTDEEILVQIMTIEQLISYRKQLSQTIRRS